MTPRQPGHSTGSLAAQRLALRQQLQQQREQIAQRVTLVRASSDTFPRSITMRFLLRRPALVAGLLTQLAAMMLGARLLKALTAALFMARFLLTVRANASAPALPPALPSSLPDHSNIPD